MCQICAKNELQSNNIEFSADYSLSNHSTFRIGGNAKIAVFPKNALELVNSIEIAIQNEVKYVVVGNCSNILFNDNGFDGMIIFSNSINHIFIRENEIICGCGANLSSIVEASLKNSLTGAEFLLGIPGTVGGAVYMNCGACGGTISDIFINGTFYSEHNGIVMLDKNDIEFDFRHSKLMNSDYILLDATFKLSYGNTSSIKSILDENARKRSLQPVKYPSAGSVFLPANGKAAWEYISECGLRGYSIGGAMISTEHAGFIINTGNATSKDVKELINHIKNAVFEKYSVELKEEIIFIGD